MKIAVIGSGVSGLGAALALSEKHRVTLFEKDGRLGGHANTATVGIGGEEIAVDTGFIVFNEVNYPNLCSLFRHLDVPSKYSDMSFGFSMQEGRLEYACDSLDKIFAQRRNAFRPGFWRAFRDVMRFVRVAPRQLAEGTVGDVTLGEWLRREGFGRLFRDCFLLPMGGAIWSTPSEKMMAFPAENLLAFFANHDLYTGLAKAVPWRTVDGGSKVYVDAVASRLSDVRTGRGVEAVRRKGRAVELIFPDGRRESFDHVVLATHAPEARRMLVDMDGEERAILSDFRTTRNTAILHRDASLMPRRRKVWSSWSMLCDGAMGDAGRPVTLTYWMNRLQSLPTDHDVFVTLNADRMPDPALTFGAYEYAHPYYDRATFAAQRNLDLIQGRGGVWYAGAWTGWGFHEDGLKSGLRVAVALGATPEWAVDAGEPLAEVEHRIAAE